MIRIFEKVWEQIKNICGVLNFRLSFQKHKKAFALAEVLVTLTIIGVVSAMTIPTLQQRHSEQATVNKIKKFYTTMAQAYQKTIVENGDVENWGITGNKKEDALIIYNYLIKDNFKIMRDCGFDNDGDCVYDGNYKFLSGAETGNYANNDDWNYYKLILNDGASVWFRGDDNVYVDVFYDINGPQPPNQWGKDLFDMYVINGKLTPSGTPESVRFFDNECKKDSTGYGCMAWVVYKENMDYLRCGDLKWNGKQKCGK